MSATEVGYSDVSPRPPTPFAMVVLLMAVHDDWVEEEEEEDECSDGW